MGYSVWTESCSRWGPVMVCCEYGNDRWGLSEARSVCSLRQISNKFTGPCGEHQVCVCVCVRAQMRSRSPGRQLSGRAAHVLCSAPSHSRLFERNDELTRNFWNVSVIFWFLKKNSVALSWLALCSKRRRLVKLLSPRM